MPQEADHPKSVSVEHCRRFLHALTNCLVSLLGDLLILRLSLFKSLSTFPRPGLVTSLWTAIEVISMMYPPQFVVDVVMTTVELGGAFHLVHNQLCDVYDTCMRVSTRSWPQEKGWQSVYFWGYKHSLMVTVDTKEIHREHLRYGRICFGSMPSGPGGGVGVGGVARGGFGHKTSAAFLKDFSYSSFPTLISC